MNMSAQFIDRAIAVALTAVSVAAIVLSARFPGDADVFPVGMSYLLIATCVALFVQSFRQAEEETKESRFEFLRFAIWCALAVLLFFLVTRLDFYLGIGFFIFLSYTVLARKSVLFSIVAAGVFTLMLYLVFDVALGVQTPSQLVAFMRGG